MKHERSVDILRGLFLPLLASLSLVTSCSSDKEQPSSESFAVQVANQVAPVAEMTGTVAVAKFSPQDAKNELILAELTDAHAPEMQSLKDSLCSALKDGSENSATRSENGTIAQEVLRDQFLIEFLRAASMAAKEKQDEIAQSLEIKSTGNDGSPLESGLALKEASLLGDQGELRIPSSDTSEYAEYVQWLGNNPVFSGFMLTLTADYTKTVRECS